MVQNGPLSSPAIFLLHIVPCFPLTWLFSSTHFYFVNQHIKAFYIEESTP